MNPQELMDAHDINKIELVASQYGELFDWFNKEYPESTIRLDVNNNKVFGILEYKLTILTGKEMSGNQGHFVNTIRIDRKQFEDLSYMQKFANSVVPLYKKIIAKAINDHYRKERDTSEKTFSF